MAWLNGRWLALVSVSLWVSVACGGNPELNGGSDDGGDGGTSGTSASGGSSNSSGGIVINPGTGEGGEGDQPAQAGGGPLCDPEEPDCQTELPGCGDGKVIEGEEECDDGNSLPGDGCSGICTIENNFECPPEGGECTTTIVCGDGTVQGGEVCDDGNTDDEDGCAADCASVEPGYDCMMSPCQNTVICGDGKVTGDEACDDAGAANGCLEDCSGVKSGWVCLRPGQPCLRLPVCGDGVLNPGEECDDGNEDSDDGCATAANAASPCTVEAGFVCPKAGELCLAQVCGDGVRTPGEACDDGNAVAGDGCSVACKVDSGWVCPLADAPCVPKCGNGVLTGYETCDDGNTASGDGCSAGCQREPGSVCGAAGEACTKSVCGNGVKEGDEGCDDDNVVAGDGCGPTCQKEPVFTGRVATVVCGDGAIDGSETCDDGNTNAGDGCSADCKTVESGYTCEDYQPAPDSIALKITYRDVEGRQDTNQLRTGEHPDFEWKNEQDKGIPGRLCTLANALSVQGCGTLDANDKPVLVGNHNTILNANSYKAWYQDSTNPRNQKFEESIELTKMTVGGVVVYRFDDSTFFPLDGRGYGDYKQTGHNFHFTSEVQYYFQYLGGERLDFRGDDDVWVFINGKLAVDLGGQHSALDGFVLLGDEDGDGTLSTAEQAAETDRRFGITKGSLYQLSFFHAERHTFASNFRLTLTNFIPRRSICSPICGDGKLQRGEVCDDGDKNANGVYGVCNETCSGLDFCGDGELNGPEQCDNGLNISLYKAAGSTACAPGCLLPGSCGDGVIQVGQEWCDDGAQNQNGKYDGCTKTCELGPYCGDGTKNGPEECDKGQKNGGYGAECGYDCKPAPYCGDAVRNGTEQCDLGTEKNTGDYGGCNANCTNAPACGDGLPQDGEQCDDGDNAGGYGKCAPGCVYGPRCGDGVVQKASGEQCDDGDNEGGYGKCAPGCKFGPRCGDGKVQVSAGEQCDDGNTKNGDGCQSTCKPQRDPS